ncbi:IS256 family transposase [Rhodoferax sp.]|uniref:IS256 family transposase n=1 Tax=Rhodoferax sp. TaxID=50421 RepID=UPI00374CEB98
MAQRAQLDDSSNPLHDAYACLLANGLDGAGEALRILVNEASRIERAQHLQAMPYERSAQRVDQANGYKPKTMLTRMGEITFEVPQVRSSGFYPSALERGSRSEQSMNLALAEMYVQGVSTRKVITVLQQLVGPQISISSTQISRCAEKLDAGLEAWRTRPLDETPYVLLDARYERVREGNQIVDCAVLVAIGVTASGQRRVLGVSVALSEAEVHWRAFLDSLIQRGLRGVKFIASDDHAGLKAARKAMFPGVLWQRCQFHLQHNAQGYVSKVEQRKVVARQIRAIFSAPDVHEANRLLNIAIEGWTTAHPKLATWAQENIPEGFTVFGLSVEDRVRMHTINGLERLNKELKRRTRVATLFPNTASCMRLVSAMLAEHDEEWMSAKIYLNMIP